MKNRRSDFTSNPPRISIVMCFWSGLVIFLYAIFETSFHVLAPSFFSVAIELNHTLEYIESNELTIDEFVERLKVIGKANFILDDEMGWDKPADLRRGCRRIQCVDPFRILVLGDSVTVGHRVVPGKEDYVSLLAARPYRRDVEFLNAAVGGFGLYQMTIKSARELVDFDADLVLFAYIDNDLIRSTSNNMWGRTRPTFVPYGNKIRVVPAPDFSKFLKQYQRAKSDIYFGAWMLGSIWENRRYYFRSFYPDYYSKVFDDILNRIEAQARAKMTQFVIVRLPQNFDFRGREMMFARFTAATRKLQTRKYVNSVDIEPCVRTIFRGAGVDFDLEMAALHPPVGGHAAYAECLYQQVIEPAVSATANDGRL